SKIRRRALKAAADINYVSTKDWTRLVRRFEGRCAYCGASGPLHMDHIVPLARGGRHGIGNLLPACASCNCSKGAKLLMEWRRDAGHNDASGLPAGRLR